MSGVEGAECEDYDDGEAGVEKRSKASGFARWTAPSASLRVG